MSTSIKVFAVDDSRVIRLFLRNTFRSDEDTQLVGEAENGKDALEQLKELSPDVIITDLNMPIMGGIDFIKAYEPSSSKAPVIVLSSLAKKDAAITLEALSLGASDFLTKTAASSASGQGAQLLREKILAYAKLYGGHYRLQKEGKAEALPKINPFLELADASEKEEAGELEKESSTPGPGSAHTIAPAAAAATTPVGANVLQTKKVSDFFPKWAPITPSRPFHGARAVVIGSSTGGPAALRKVMAGIRPDFPLPMAIVQHMPAGFTTAFAETLDSLCPLTVREAKEGDLMKPGRVLVAPGDFHLTVQKQPLATIVHLTSDPKMNGHRPSVDYFFKTALKVYGGELLAIILTGMGRDGAFETGEIYGAGGYTIAQDEKSSLVYGMPKAVVDNGYATSVIDLEEVSNYINEIQPLA